LRATAQCPLATNLSLYTSNFLKGTLFSCAHSSAPQLSHLNIQLQVLRLAHNRDITKLPADLLRDAGAALLGLDLVGTGLTVLPPDLFRPLRSIVTLSFSDNSRLTSLPETLFQGLSTLEYLFMQNNKLDIALPANLFRDCVSLRSVAAANCTLTYLPEALFRYTHKLEIVYFEHNQLTQIPASLFANHSALREVNLQENRLGHLSPHFLSGTPGLTWLRLDGNPVAADVPALLRGLPPSARLSFLGLRDVGLTDFLVNEAMLASATTSVASSPQMGNALMSLETLDVSKNSLRSLDVTLLTTLKFLNVSNNRDLNLARLPGATILDVLDAGGTSMHVSLALCGHSQFTYSGAKIVILQNLYRAPPQKEMLATLRFCLAMPIVIDLSQNKWLTNVKGLTWPDDGPFFPLDAVHSSLVLQGSPVQCNWRRSVVDNSFKLASVDNFSVYTEHHTAVVRLDCRCSPGYEEESGSCQRALPWIAKGGHLALVVILAMLALLPVLVWFGVRARRRLKITFGDLELERKLLEGAEREIHSMKQAWKIEQEDIVMQQQIASGAYGEVWRGRYDGTTVAIKVPHPHLLDLDDWDGNAAFDQEVSFLQHVRHSHLVRFLGAGKLETGAPFLVLEYVPNGSLNSFLRRVDGLAWSEDRGGSAGAMPTVGAATSLPSYTAELRLRFAHHIALGMAYIHERGHLHRDLKSDNVLLTSDWRAKVTDFGTTRLWRLASDAQQAIDTRSQRSWGWKLLSATDTAAPKYAASTATVGIGTPPYMSPEVLEAEAYDEKADVWAYGCILWELVNPDLLDELGIAPGGPYCVQLGRYLNEGKRLPLRETETAALEPSFVDLMRSCWAGDAGQRPSFDEASRLLSFLQKQRREGSTAL
jgi:hypothetical protein